MCDLCGIESQPTRAFSNPKFRVVDRERIKLDLPRRYCLPCFRNALSRYKAASVPVPGPRPPEGMTEAPLKLSGRNVVIHIDKPNFFQPINQGV